MPKFLGRASAISKPMRGATAHVLGIAASGVIAALLSSPLTAAEKLWTSRASMEAMIRKAAAINPETANNQ